MESESNNRGGPTSDRSGIDTVVSSQPELGPSIPDGGYGWIILIAAIFFQAIIPSMMTAYGTFLLFSKLEHSSFSYPMLWDDDLIHTPLLFITFWTISDPWSRKLITQSTWPRLVGTAGTCLTCAGLLFMWIATNSTTKIALYILAGIFCGLGASILTSQTEILVAQYFRLKLPIVNDIIKVAITVGFIVTPIIIGDNVVEHGFLRVLICYQAIILQGIVVCLFFRKPQYLKAKRRVYQYVSSSPDDEEDVFTKDVRELQNKRENTDKTETLGNTSVTIESQPGTSSNLNEESKRKKNWVKFNDKSPSTKETLQESFSKNLRADMDKIEKFEDNFVDIPRPLFSDTFVNNNTTYSYEIIDKTGEVTEEPVVFMPVHSGFQRQTHLQQTIEHFKQPIFYKSLLIIVTTKFSEFTFYTLFPSYLYVTIDSLKVHHTTTLVGCLSITGIFFIGLVMWINVNTAKRPVFLYSFCWLGSIGYILLSEAKSEALLLLGAIQIIISINSLQFIGVPLLNLTRRGESNESHRILSTISGLMFSLLLIDFSYSNCFRLMACLQFITAGVGFGNYAYQKIRRS